MDKNPLGFSKEVIEENKKAALSMVVDNDRLPHNLSDYIIWGSNHSKQETKTEEF